MGKLNILPQKSWHVYSKANRERVRRDEEQARNEQEENAGRARKAEAEYRISRLRGKDDAQGREIAAGGAAAILPEAPNEPTSHSRGSSSIPGGGGQLLVKAATPWYATQPGSSSSRHQAPSALLSGDPLIMMKAHDERVKKRRSKIKEIGDAAERELRNGREIRKHSGDRHRHRHRHKHEHRHRNKHKHKDREQRGHPE
ncbi:hypothetical protein GQ54DRAFT_309268 [Martensiomyces pterosporus]|nr:hypothetical protein GQ54DRAFT_309268 [Martensiomyces pterosporus]